MTYEEVCKYAEDQDICVKVLSSPSYNNSIIGISYDNRVIYDYDLMIETLRQEETFPRNTYVAAVDDVNHYFELNDSMNNDIGSYIETLLEKKQREEGLELVTIGDLMDEDRDAKENVPVLNMGEIPGNN